MLCTARAEPDLGEGADHAPFDRWPMSAADRLVLGKGSQDQDVAGILATPLVDVTTTGEQDRDRSREVAC